MCSLVVWLTMMISSISSSVLILYQGVVEAFRRHGVAQQMQDGTFDFVAVSKPKSQSELIKKLAHGRLSKTKDGAIQLTLKVFFHEGLNIAQTLAVESAEGADALVDYQLKR